MKKKLLSIFALLLACLASSQMEIKADQGGGTEAIYAIGDLNGDRIRDVTDVGILIDFVLVKANADDYQGASPDLDNNNIIDVADVNELIDIVLGKQVTFALASTSVELTVGESKDIEILMGSSWYKIENEASDIVSASIDFGGSGSGSGSSSGGIPDEVPLRSSGTGSKVQLQGLAAGNGIVKVRDLASSEEVSISVTVTEGTEDNDYVKDVCYDYNTVLDGNNASIYLKIQHLPFDGESIFYVMLSEQPNLSQIVKSSSVTCNGKKGEHWSNKELPFATFNNLKSNTTYYWGVYYFDWEYEDFIRCSPIISFTTGNN